MHLTYRWLVLLPLLIFSCASMSKTTQVVNETNRRNAGSGLWEFENSSADSLWWNALQQAALPWLGTPYLWGGEGPDSVDCSAFVRAVFYKVNGDSLPRRAAWQYLQGFPVPMDCLRPGDLVFFGRPAIGVEHVGIYWGGGWFINATVSRGVAFSRLDESFWKERILGARRRYRL